MAADKVSEARARSGSASGSRWARSAEASVSAETHMVATQSSPPSSSSRRRMAGRGNWRCVGEGAIRGLPVVWVCLVLYSNRKYNPLDIDSRIDDRTQPKHDRKVPAEAVARRRFARLGILGIRSRPPPRGRAQGAAPPLGNRRGSEPLHARGADPRPD